MFHSLSKCLFLPWIKSEVEEESLTVLLCQLGKQCGINRVFGEIRFLVDLIKST